MKIICISDTHNLHRELLVPPGDVVIHAGDFTEAGSRSETMEFLKWFSSLPHPHKILIAGNHDFYLEKHQDEPDKIIPENVHYLNESGISIENVKFWGAPFTPGDGHWAFNRKRGAEIRQHWALIPEDTDILITHSPPFGLLDELDNKRHIGCEELGKQVKKLKIPHHVFGHVHNDYGVVKTGNTMFINSSSLDGRYRHINAPSVLHVLPS